MLGDEEERKLMMPGEQKSVHELVVFSPSAVSPNHTREQLASVLMQTDITDLRKMERVMELDSEFANWHQEYKNSTDLRHWLGLLNQIDDEMLQKLCGSDAALYLVFLRLSSLFFGFIAILNIVFIILFATGNPEDDFNFRKNMST